MNELSRKKTKLVNEKYFFLGKTMVYFDRNSKGWFNITKKKEANRTSFYSFNSAFIKILVQNPFHSCHTFLDIFQTNQEEHWKISHDIHQLALATDFQPLVLWWVHQLKNQKKKWIVLAADKELLSKWHWDFSKWSYDHICIKCSKIEYVTKVTCLELVWRVLTDSSKRYSCR